MGRLVPYKGPGMLLEAVIPLVRSGSVLVDIVGDGPMLGELQALVARENLGNGVSFHGWVPHERVQDLMAAADLFGFPSIREFGGAVVLEAMATGLAPLVVAYGGPAELVTPETGMAVPMGTRHELVQALRSRVLAAVADPSRIDNLGRAAAVRARQLFTWEAKAQQVLEVYRWALGKRHALPDFGMPLTHRA